MRLLHSKLKKKYLFDSGNILKQRKGIRKHWIHCSRSLRVFRASCDATEKNSTSNRYVAWKNTRKDENN